MKFSLSFFGADDPSSGNNRYSLVLEASRRADALGLDAVWIPERHFNPFGGAFPNPSVVAAAIATVTNRIGIRAGSVVSPLHDVMRVAEEWSVVDNLSGGRAAVSFGSGWNINDFIFYPDRYALRRELMYEQVEQLKRLWRGEPITRRGVSARELKVRLSPQPRQTELPIWITASGAAETFVRAGGMGANLLTHLLGQSVEELERKVLRYRAAREGAGYDPAGGVITVLLHTFVGSDAETVKRTVEGPLISYLKVATKLELEAATGGGSLSGGLHAPSQALSDRELTELSNIAFERYYASKSLIGTVDVCRQRAERLSRAGVNEVACLVDFGIESKVVLQGLDSLDVVRRSLC